MRMTITLLIPGLLVLGLLAACAGGSSQATRYYLIDPINLETPVNASADPLRIEVIDLQVPQYLERFQIASRASENRLVFSEGNQWGENLRKNLLRTLARNLSQLLATNDIGTPLNRSSSRPDLRLQVYIDQFEKNVDNRVKLIARWQLSEADGDGQSAIFAAELQSDELATGDSYDEMVSVMRNLYGQLCEEIATSIVKQES